MTPFPHQPGPGPGGVHAAGDVFVVNDVSEGREDLQEVGAVLGPSNALWCGGEGELHATTITLSAARIFLPPPLPLGKQHGRDMSQP